MIHYRVDEYIVEGDRVVALGSCSFRNKRTGKVLEFYTAQTSAIATAT